ncbi:hypothetical protein GCM10009759_75680 [Kitasatospora saccharophila]|uniref:Tyr recombinase domain-containing protein n=1 Tax=Kitasatospora saccharophila TaxID=407973 RepID=A0ABP5K338_9ACTN
MRRIPLKDTRHTTASLLAALEVHPNDAQKILRHARVTTTLGIYTHVPTATQRAAASALDERFRELLDRAPGYLRSLSARKSALHLFYRHLAACHRRWEKPQKRFPN